MRDFEFPGRSAVHAANGMAATSHPLATGAALDVLKEGGNAMDAAICAAAVQAVVEPQSTGIGGDVFALMCPKGSSEVIAYNGSGRSPAAATVEWYQKQGIDAIKQHSPHSVTVPGAIEAWCRLNADHGSLPLDRLLAPAIRYAGEGYAVHARVRYDWLQAVQTVSWDADAKAVFLPGGKVPAEGQIHVQPKLAETLKTIAEKGRAGFYEGPVAEAMAAKLKSLGGLHTVEDFAATEGDYVTPITTDYRGYTIHQIPPNNQGVTALIMLNILEGFDLAQYDPLSAERTHLEMEAGRIAFAVRDSAISDPRSLQVTREQLVSKEWAAGLRANISLDRAMPDIPDLGLKTSDTVYISVVDKDLNAVSFINSVYYSFGSGILCPQTGVHFQNRGESFRIDPNHPNRMGPSKRPMHTIMPGMLTRGSEVVSPYGVMGGDYQPYGHTRVLTNVIDFGLDPQAAISMPRVFATGDLVNIEKTFPAATYAGLQARGHKLNFAPAPLGGGQMILIDRDKGVLSAGSEHRKDGCALGY
jgi:gamma-glutamyltranspeptidase/glutathione hydrolase